MIDYDTLGTLRGLDDIVEERVRQVRDLGYDVAHDAEHHTPEELMQIGVCYTDLAILDLQGSTAEESWGESQHPFWPDTSIPWVPEKSSIENAAKGAAFIAASLDLTHAQIEGRV